MSTSVKRIGKYELQECLKQGGLSEVWKANDPQRHTAVAVKLLLMEVTDDENEEYTLRFTRESKRLAALHHSNIASIQDAQISSTPRPHVAMSYLATDYIEGITLAEYMQSMPRSGILSADVVRIFALISMAVDYAHQHGIVHGRLKPTNVLLRRVPQGDGKADILEPVVTDFGIYKLLETTTGSMPRRSLDEALYVSPEQARGTAPTTFSDLYTLGVLLYEMCTGIVPFQGTRPVALLMQHASAVPPSPAMINPNISPALTEVLLRSLEKDPEKRFTSATAMTLAVAKACKISLPERLNYQVYSLDAMEAARNGTEAEVLSSSSASARVSSLPPKPRKTRPVPLEDGPVTPVPAQMPPPIVGRRTLTPRPRRKVRSGFVVLIAILLITLVVVGMGGMTLLRQQQAAAPAQTVGHVYFLNSGQFNEHVSNQGGNDQLLVDLPGVSSPAAGNNYYAWLLPDKDQTEAPPVFVGKMPVKNGRIYYLYPGVLSHADLLAITSRFLITEEDASSTPNLPSTDTHVWRYYAELAQTPSSTDKDHFSMLDHFRHLLVDAPELQKLNLHGGLAMWLLQDTQKVFDLSSVARDAWQRGDMASVKQNMVLLMDYLDGKMLVQKDLPAGTPFLANENEVQIPLLGRDPKQPISDNGSDTPVGYVYLIGLHLAGAVSSPQVTAEQRTQAAQVDKNLDDLARRLEQLHDKAKGIASLNENGLTQLTTLAALNDLVSGTREVYNGHVDQTSGQTQGGAVGVYHGIQKLVNFTVQPYHSS